MIFTSNFATLKKLPKEGFTPISIARSAPSWYKGIEYKKLAPTWDILNDYRKTGDKDIYIKDYTEQILNQLDPYKVRQELMDLAQDWQIVLVCYEKPEDFCHRHIVADWLDSYGIPVLEVAQKWN